MQPTEAPSLTWVNHASFVLEYGGLRIICDPWISGKAFNRGWRLIAETKFSYEDFRDITHIWFSHQHPDHFSPLDLKKIPPEFRRRITVLYHRTIDKKVVRFCRGLGFRDAIELEEYRWLRLAPKLEILCNGWSDQDSWIAFRTEAGTLLNVNDCVIDSEALARRIARSVGPVKLLATQFSYANWMGNPGDIEFRRAQAREKLERIRIQTRVFGPEYVVPFASFVCFCHEENFYHNAEMNRVGDAAAFIETLSRKPVVLYPGETWRLGDPHTWHGAATRYDADVRRCIEAGPCERVQTVELTRIEHAASNFLKRLRRKNPVIRFVPGLATVIHVSDFDQTFELSLRGFRPAPPDTRADIAMSSDSLFFAFRTPWGSNALGVNGRYLALANGDSRRFFRFFRAADLNDHGRAFDVTWAVAQISKSLKRQLRRPRGHSCIPRTLMD